jgi:hypothetical protein
MITCSRSNNRWSMAENDDRENNEYTCDEHRNHDSGDRLG